MQRAAPISSQQYRYPALNESICARRGSVVHRSTSSWRLVHPRDVRTSHLRTTQVVDALTSAGFVVEEVRDLAPESAIPWYAPFAPKYELATLKTTPIGIAITHAFVVALEMLWLAPKGAWRARGWGAAEGARASTVTRNRLTHPFARRHAARHVQDALAPHRGRARPVRRRRHEHLHADALLQGDEAGGGGGGPPAVTRRGARDCA